MEELKRWRAKPGRKPLVLSGARQVGKTWLLKEFGKTCFSSVAYVNFDKALSARLLFDGDFDLRRILAGLQAIGEAEIRPEETLVVLDEIQTCPAALKALKYFQEDAPQYCVAAAGSLIGLSLIEGTGYPVGKTNSMTLYPMGFGEFLAAIGKGGLAQLLASGGAEELAPFHQSLCVHLKDYLFVGGMPAAVESFSRNNSYAAAREEQKAILGDYARDFGKHAPKAQVPRIKAIWQSLPLQLAKQDKRFVSAEIPQDGDLGKIRARDLRDPFEWLEAAGLVYRVWNVSKPGLPLASYRNHVFKLFGADVGLLGAQSRLDARTVLDGNAVFTEFKGALTEQFVQQELRAAAGLEPFFWTAPDSRAEVDFLVETSNAVLPIEAKAERNLRAKSLVRFMEKFSPPVAVRTSMAEWSRGEKILDIPLYAIGRILL